MKNLLDCIKRFFARGLRKDISQPNQVNIAGTTQQSTTNTAPVVQKVQLKTPASTPPPKPKPAYVLKVESFLEKLSPTRAKPVNVYFGIEEIQKQLDSKKHNDQSLNFFNSGKLEDGINELLLAIDINPMHEMAYCNLAYVLIENGQPATALKVLNILQQINPEREELSRYMKRARQALQ